ncbi:AI-2E family transporter [Pseudobutyrivibrio sp.]|uniref:AI-2E family transporter n=1 Tax=Pseudobutyrivibrio sp. TaxID=2014367 RepID=UPI0025D6530C|nr:AI-2E family transporter [Pseudobutyrivibrio sp.]MBR5649541.1 AI-2E family transporter [Pseudobutyrivibrio sp.]
MKKFRDRPWYSLAVSICIGVILFVALIRIGDILDGIGTFVGFFSTVFLGAVIAYIINPLGMLYRRKLFGKLKNEGVKAALGNFLAFVTVIIFLVIFGLTVVPQLIESIKLFASNLDGYAAGLQKTLVAFGVSSNIIDLNEFVTSSSDLIATITKLLSENISTVLSATASIGKTLGTIFIAFLLSMYFLAEKDKLVRACKRFLKALCKDKYDDVKYVIKKSDFILSRYIVFNILDAIVVGIVNAIYMAIVGLPYIGLVSMVVAVMNLIPTFGPVIGGAIGAFLLLLVKPWYAAVFIIFTLILQMVDGYILKPKLVGDSVGVSGLWVLIGVIVGGKMFGIIGILLCIPAVAILEMLYSDFLLPWLERGLTSEESSEENN